MRAVSAARRCWSLLFIGAIVAIAIVRVHAQAPAAAKDPDVAARVQLEFASLYERNGRLAEAEAAFLKAATEGSDATRRIARLGLERLLFAREMAGARSLLDLGEIYESAGDLAAAQAAYQKVIEGGPPSVQAEARRRLAHVVSVRAGWWAAHVEPLLKWLTTAVLTAALVAALVLVVGPSVSEWGQWRGRRSLSLSVKLSPGTQEVGGAFESVFADVYERMKGHFRPRIFLRDRSMPSYVRSQSTELIDLVGKVSPGLVPFLGWFKDRWHQPAYRVSVVIEVAQQKVHAIASLKHNGASVKRWNETIWLATWIDKEQDLAYEILITAKEHSDGNASGI